MTLKMAGRKKNMGPMWKKLMIAGKGINSLSHNNLVHNFVLLPQAMKIPDAKAAVENNRKN